MSTERDLVRFSLTVLSPILSGDERARPGDSVHFTEDGRAFIVHEIPANGGRWLGYLTDGLAAPRSHSADETIAALVRLAAAPPPPPPPARRPQSA